MRRLPRTLPPDWALALLLLTGLFLYQRTVFPLWMVDVFPQQLGAYFLKHGEPEWMYTPSARKAEWIIHRAPVAERLGAEGDPNPFFYPPFVAALLTPFADSPAALWRDVLFGLNVAVVFVLAWQILRFCEARGWRAYLWALALVLVSYPLARATQLGQIVPLLAALLWAGLLALRRGKDRSAGALLGLVGAVKIFPLALIALPVVGRRYRAAMVWGGAAAGIFLVSLITLGLRVHLWWWQVMDEFSGLVQPFYGNQAPLGWIARVFYGKGWVETGLLITPLLALLKVLSLAFFLGGSVYLLWRLRDRIMTDAFPPACGLLLSGLHLALPVMWEHYYLFVLPCLAWAVREVWLRGDQPLWEILLAAALFFFTMKLTRFYGDSLPGRILSGSQMLGMLLLWLWFVHRVWLLSAPAREPQHAQMA